MMFTLRSHLMESRYSIGHRAFLPQHTNGNNMYISTGWKLRILVTPSIFSAFLCVQLVAWRPKTIIESNISFEWTEESKWDIELRANLRKNNPLLHISIHFQALSLRPFLKTAFFRASNLKKCYMLI